MRFYSVSKAVRSGDGVQFHNKIHKTCVSDGEFAEQALELNKILKGREVSLEPCENAKFAIISLKVLFLDEDQTADTLPILLRHRKDILTQKNIKKKKNLK
jgi:hypothetical protein